MNVYVHKFTRRNVKRKKIKITSCNYLRLLVYYGIDTNDTLSVSEPFISLRIFCMLDTYQDYYKILIFNLFNYFRINF